MITRQVFAGDVPKDFTSNNVYFQTDGSPGPTDWQDVADHVKNAFSGATGSFTAWAGNKITVTAYDLADAKPRPVKATSVYTPASWDTGTYGPRCLACCLSYYSGRNLPHERGRIYIGPWFYSHSNEKPDATVLGYCMNLAHSLYGISLLGSMSWLHSVHSKVAGTTHAVNHYWSNDVWDIQRSRLSKETSRSRYDP
jgi:hypothetical protein